ncbi:ABC transporter substrate-binding protein [Streptosporangium sp. NPDC001681]|uniref:ABC transporter substrate-binding protein n=1 Tax=Streptosporangium sp. NPDC001681 TaxID=3154395 RepID=UPI00332C546F
MDFGIRLLYRTLATFKAEPGAAGAEIVPDLATDLGTPSEGGKAWTFTLKEGVKYEDGTPIRAQDINQGPHQTVVDDRLTDRGRGCHVGRSPTATRPRPVWRRSCPAHR